MIMSHVRRGLRRMLRQKPSGFTLVELAIGILVISLLLGSILVPLSAQVEQRKVTETQRALDEIRESLIGFALSNGHLPCPDKMGANPAGGTGPNDGLEDVTGNNCVVAEGNLPWATLGAPTADSWGNRIRYRVDATFSQRAPPVLALNSGSGIEVCADGACAVRLTNTSPNGPAAIVMSHGKNGFGAMSATNNLQNPAPVSADELENTDMDVTFVSRVQTAVGTTAGEFDDIVAWLPRTVLFNRMVAAGKLP